ncbi:protein phosphatase 2A regulatory B subunit [Cryptosporidium ryanae]|uniref:protein phosphatase 2A regulatory B subunit n=1 Tax=Cryptosporidium ryanae TaxID=515981 RepID=UPI003519E2DA|nr:protein phosphatase 2A regulatory B subunit [Cryptosporidium ryanae]
MNRVFQSLRRKVSNTETNNNEQNNLQGSKNKQDSKNNSNTDNGNDSLNLVVNSDDSQFTNNVNKPNSIFSDSETATQYLNDDGCDHNGSINGDNFFKRDIKSFLPKNYKNENSEGHLPEYIELNKVDPITGIINISFPPIEFIKTEKFSFLCTFIKNKSNCDKKNNSPSDNERDSKIKNDDNTLSSKSETNEHQDNGESNKSTASNENNNIDLNGNDNNDNLYLNGTLLPLPNGLIEVSNGVILIKDPFSSLPLLQKVKTNEVAIQLIKKKLMACCVVFNFSSNQFNNLKEKKRETLLELVEYINNNDQVFQEGIIPYVLLMITSNIFRSFNQFQSQVISSNVSSNVGSNGNNGSNNNTASNIRSINNNVSSGLFSSAANDPKDDEQLLEPSWPHLLVIYEFFLRFVISSQFGTKIAKKYIDNSLILKLIDLFQSFDPRERDYLKTILHRIYGKIMTRRSCIRKAMKYIFLRVIIDGEPYNGIAELLEIFVSIVNGFTIPLKEEHKLFLETALIPLHKAKHISSFHQQLIYCLIQYIEKDTKLSVPIIEGVLKYWPITNSSKQILFLNELEELLEITPTNYIEPILIPIFERLAACIQSPHFHVAERVLYLWNNEIIVNLINEYKYDIYPVLIRALSCNGKKLHWNPTVHGLSFVVNKVLSETDPDLFSQIIQQNNNDNANIEIHKKKREEYWKYIIDLAESMDQ